VIAAIIAAAIAAALPALPPLAGFLVRGSVTVLVFAALLWSGGFMRPTERAFLWGLWARAERVRR